MTTEGRSRRGRGVRIADALRANTWSTAAGAVLLAILAIAAVVPLASTVSPETQDFRSLLQPPSLAHPVGTDDLGRDVFLRLAYGARISLLIGVAATAGATIAGAILGLAAGYLGGRTDVVVMRFTDVLLAFPTLLLAVAIVGTLGPSLANATLAISLVIVPRFSRLVRAEAMRIRAEEFITAAVAVGLPSRRIILRHILPNLTSVVVVQFSLSVAASMLSEAGLSFLGLGVPPPTPSWGTMLRSGYPFLDRAPWIAFGAGLALTTTVVTFSMLSDLVRDLLDPRLRHR